MPAATTSPKGMGTNMRKKKHAESGRGQKIMSFRADFETLSILAQCENKGRKINELVQEWGRSQNIDERNEEFAIDNDITDEEI